MLTASQLAICAIIFGAGVGTGVATKQVKQASAMATAKPKGQGVVKTAPASGASRAAPPARILDCPVIGSPWAAVDTPSVPLLPPMSGTVPAPLVPGGGGSSSLLPPPSFPHAVPVVEPTRWAMMIAGFGLVGLAMRRQG